MNALASTAITFGSLTWKPESVFVGVVLIATGLRIWQQGSIWWHHIMDWFIGGVAMSQVPRFAESVSKVTDQPWAAYGVSAILAVLTIWLSFGGKKK